MSTIICRPCVDWLVKERNTSPAEILDLYGKDGVNYAPAQAAAP